MNKTRIYLVVAATFLLVTACKKEDASSKIDANATEIAPASPDAVVPTQTPTTAQTTSQPQQVQPNAQPVAPPSRPTTQMTFSKKEHNFGEIKQGDKVSHFFTFKNTGKNDLIISNATGSCGCTVPEFPKEPIKPGKSGKMKVTFDSTGKTGQQSKTVTVTANTEKGTEILTVKSTIKGGEPKITTTTTTTPAPSAIPETLAKPQ